MTDSLLDTASADSIAELFKADPTTLDDAALTRLTIELRRRRSEFTASEAAAASKPKAASRRAAPALPAAEAAALDKPLAETGLDDFLD